MLATLNSGSKKDTPQRVQFGNFDIMNDAEGRPLALGKGTFGRTYQARHRYLDTIVALKIINERYAADAGVRQRFLVEARAVARLSHPHIARLYDFGEVDGVLHYAMEYCGGGSLADHVAKNGPFGVGQVVEVGQQIAGALKCAHSAGFIHRDLKPSNIMLTEAKGPMFAKLIDFGLVQPSLPEATRSVSDDQSADGARFLGTPLFASPEQLKEEPMDIRTDLFSLGMTLWYLLLGRAPDSGSSAEIAASRLSPESYVTQLPAALLPQLRTVLGRLLQKDRQNRFASAAEVLTAFNACATTLGLRRPRDYTSATESPEWDEPEPAPESEQVARAEPAEIERVEAELESEFKITTRVNDDFTGSNYVAESKAQAGALVFLHVLHPALVEDVSVFELLRVHMTQLRTLGVPEILQPRALREYSDYVSIVIDRPEGGDLLSILRAERVVHLVEAAPLLESIAGVCDRLAAAGLPGPQLAPAHIFVEWPDGAGRQNAGISARRLSQAGPKLYPRFLAVSEAPELARLNEPEDASSTMTSDMLGDPSRADNVCEHFGTLLYRIVAGRNCPIAASLSSQAYVPVPGLSEQANRLLSLVIAKQIALASCGQVLREILGAEGIAPRSPGHPSAGFTVPGTGSTVTSPGATPALPLRTPPKTSTSTASRFRRMPVAPSAVVPPPLVIPPPRPIEPARSASAASAPTPAEVKSVEVDDHLDKVEEPPTVELKPIPEAPSAAVSPPPLVIPPPRPIEPARSASAASAPPPVEVKSVEVVDDHLGKVEEPPTVELKPIPEAPSAAVSPPPLVVPPPRPIEPARSASAASAPPPAEVKSVEAVDGLLGKVDEPPAAEVPKPPTLARETMPVPAVTTRESAPKSATPTGRLPAEGETKDRTPTPAQPKTTAKKSRQIAAKTQAPETQAKEAKARTEPAPRAAPSPLEAVTVMSEKIVSPASPAPPPKITVPRAPAVRQPGLVENIVPWVSRNVRPIGIGIAALLAVSLGYGLIRKISSRNVNEKIPAERQLQVRERPLPPAEAVAPAASESTAEQDKIDADRLLAERAAQDRKADEAKVAEEKAAADAKEKKDAEDAKVAEKKAGDEAKLLAEPPKVDPPETKVVPAPAVAANVKPSEAKTRVTQKTQKDSPPSRNSGGNRTSQSQSNRPPQVAPAPRQAPAQRPANNPRRRSEFGPTAPGG